MTIENNAPLAPFTTFKIGGHAKYFCRVKSTDDLHNALNFAKAESLPVFVLGGGSNVLISDRGFGGLVIKNEIMGVNFEDTGGEAVDIVAGSGENWDGLVEKTVANELFGIENLSHIPGSVGGAIAGNIGAYGMEVKDSVKWVEIFDAKTFDTFVLENNECDFDYRQSIFKENKNYIITKACLRFDKSGKADLSYKDVKEYFKNTDAPSLSEIRRAIGIIRKKKFPDLGKLGNAGSFFKNPFVGGKKVHLARLLEDIGVKGLRRGNVELYEKQPLVIVNNGGATAKEIKKFSEKIVREVFNKTKIKIIPEVILVGDFEN